MHTVLPLSLAVLVSVAIMLIGCLYIKAPERVVGFFGLKAPAPDADTRAWLHAKGIRRCAHKLRSHVDPEVVTREYMHSDALNQDVAAFDAAQIEAVETLLLTPGDGSPLT